MRIKTIKPKKAKEISEKKPKEIKGSSNGNSSQEEEDFDSAFESSANFSSSGRRAAPTLSESGERQSLEQVAQTAPATTVSTPESSGKLYLESNAGTSYADKKYADTKYERVQVSAGSGTVRSAGGLAPINREIMSQAPVTNIQPSQGNWHQDTQMIPEKNYETQSPDLKRRLPFERRKKF